MVKQFYNDKWRVTVFNNDDGCGTQIKFTTRDLKEAVRLFTSEKNVEICEMYDDGSEGVRETLDEVFGVINSGGEIGFYANGDDGLAETLNLLLPEDNQIETN